MERTLKSVIVFETDNKSARSDKLLDEYVLTKSSWPKDGKRSSKFSNF